MRILLLDLDTLLVLAELIDRPDQVGAHRPRKALDRHVRQFRAGSSRGPRQADGGQSTGLCDPYSLGLRFQL